MDLFAKIEENRDEKIAIPFFGWIKNPVEMMVGFILKSDRIFVMAKKYGIINKLLSCEDKNRLWVLGSMYTVKSFIAEMIKTASSPMDKRDVEKDFVDLIGNVDPSTALVTLTEALITRLTSEEFVKGIYIYAPWFSDTVKDYIKKTFMNKSKIYLVETDLKGIIEREEKMTTIFVENVDELMDIIQSYPENTQIFKGIQFNISANPSLKPDVRELLMSGGSLDRLKDKKEVFMYEEYMKTLIGRLGCDATFMQFKFLASKAEPKEKSKEV